MTPKKVRKEELLQMIPWDDINTAPWNARKTFEKAANEELVASIAKHGIQVPLIVRPLERDGFKFEIIAGHRRFNAAAALELAEVPCLVRSVPDEQARELGLVDNLQREGLPPMEEAEAYGKLLERPGVTIESVAAAIAKSPTYVGRRVQLLKAIEPVRAALKAGAIEVGHALELARLDAKQQEKLLVQLGVGFESTAADNDRWKPGVCRYCGCTPDAACQTKAGPCHWLDEKQTICSDSECQTAAEEDGLLGSPSAYRQTTIAVTGLKRLIASQALTVLSDAPFPLDLEFDHAVACEVCPKRAGNSALLFADLGQDACTDRDCFTQKVQAWIAQQLEGAAAAKRKLHRVSSSYTSEKGVLIQWNVKILAKPDECERAEDAIWIDGQNVGKQFKVCVDRRCSTHYPGASSTRTSSSARPAEKKVDKAEIEKKIKAEREYRAALCEAIGGAGRTLTPAEYGKCLVELVHETMEACLYGHDDEALIASAVGISKAAFPVRRNAASKMRDELKRLEPRTLVIAGLLTGSAAEDLGVSEYSYKQKPERLEKLAALVGIDAKKVRLAVEKKVQPTAAKAAAKPVPKKQPKKPVLTAASRKRIAEAQKKRWAAKVAKKKGGR